MGILRYKNDSFKQLNLGCLSTSNENRVMEI